MFLVLYRPLCFASGWSCCVLSSLYLGGLLVRVFPGLPPCVGYFRKFWLGVSSDRSLFLSTFVLGGGGRGGSVAIVRLYVYFRIL